MRTWVTLGLVLALTASPGCLDLFGRGLADHRVARTPVDVQGWNTDGVFTVQVLEDMPVTVRIEASSATQILLESGLSNATLPPVALVIPDGTWTVRYFIDGKKWESFKAARFDSTPPSLAGLPLLGEARDGTYTFTGASLESGASLRIIDQATGAVVATQLPATVASLNDGIHAYDVIATDAAGNQAIEQIQVRAGSAALLPAGQATLGLVARYTVEVQLWDIADLEEWITPAQARSAVGNNWLGAGLGITPADPAVVDVVDTVVTPGQTTGEAAFALFAWMADHLDYDTSRLDSDTLLTPRQTLLDREDPADTDAHANGLAADGAGNGIAGGVCRDLAATYVSLLRAAGIPARLVTGYLGGQVNGFHAWVEFYGGAGHGPSPWVPVDVSPIGSSDAPAPYSPEIALQAFAIRHTDMLPLRVVSEAQEQTRWSSAVALSISYPQGREPDVDLAKQDTLEFEANGVLCVDPDHLRRQTGTGTGPSNNCPASYPLYLPDFSLRASHVLDYGAAIRNASPGTTVTLTLSYPETAAVSPGQVEQVSYGAAFTKDAGAGTLRGNWER